ncbi:glucan endo-1,3-beta-glucosidase [Lolium perenne]|uniref:glucan endo-1,3-beta-glucosidase n=1 Tax=Lolium perenne TaxID=4522 RepID=UPI0021EA9FCF|nr:glucan endo-1,3-beta-glucosidase [Lolium perenne]
MLGSVFIILLSIAAADAAGIGVTYGRRASSLPPPVDVARFLARGTIVDRVRLLNADPLALRAFAGTGLAVDMTVPNALVPRLADSVAFTRQWVRTRVAPLAAAGTNVSRILVGREVISQANRTLLLALVPAMQNLHAALVGASLDGKITVSTAHSLGVLDALTTSPSAGRFREGYDAAVVKPLLGFLRATGAPFMVNAYPFYGLTDDTPLDFALFRVGATGVMDTGSGLLYTNALDAQLDAVHSAMDRMGFGDVDVVVAETGWPWAGEDWEKGVGADLAGDYNRNAIRHLGSGVGTPLRPNRTFEVSIFSLFDEDLKPGPLSQRHFGLFHADMTPVYDAGILTAPEYVGPVSSKVTPAAAAAVPAPAPDATAADSGWRRWCVPAPAADAAVLQENIDFVCGQGGIDCSAIRLGGSCYEPDTLQAHAAYAMNLYFRSNGDHEFDCEFGHTGVVTTADPSFGGCNFT